MKMRRFLTIVLALVMCLSVIPFGAMAAEPVLGEDADGGKLFLDKTAKLQDDGSYTIKMQAYATGNTRLTAEELAVPLDIVLVLDQSGSMADKMNDSDENNKHAQLKSAVSDFVKNVYENGQTGKVTHRIAIAGFASNKTDGRTLPHWEGLKIIAESNAQQWINTGIFDGKGNFHNYSEETSTYDKYTGPLNPEEEYYIKDGDNYKSIFYNHGTYVKVSKPDTQNVHYYGLVSGDFKPVSYKNNAIIKVSPFVQNIKGAYYSDSSCSEKNKLNWTEGYARAAEIMPEDQEFYIYDSTWKVLERTESGEWVSKTNPAEKYIVTEVQDSGVSFKNHSTDGRSFPAYRAGNDKYYLSQSNNKINRPPYEGDIYGKQSGWFTTDNIVVSTVYQTAAKGWRNGDYAFKEGSQDIFVQHTNGLTDAMYKGALVNVASKQETGENIQNPVIQKAINQIGANGATRIATGIEMGNKIFENNPLTPSDQAEGRKRIMIIFTDGEPGLSTNGEYEEIRAVETACAINNAEFAKNELGVAVYTIGLYKDTANKDRQTKFMKRLSSEYPKASYTFTQVSELPDPTAEDMEDRYAILVNGLFYGVRVRTDKDNQKEWSYYSREGKITIIPKDAHGLYEMKLEDGNSVSAKGYSHEIANSERLSEIFETIRKENSQSSTTVKLSDQSILRDIMSQEGFELTTDSQVKVQIVPSTSANNIAADQLTNDQIEWGNPANILNLGVTLKNDEHTTGDYQGKTIKASVYTHNPEGKADLHTVDVTGFDYQKQYISSGHMGSKLVVEITGVKALPTVTADKNIYTNHPKSGIWDPVTLGGAHVFRAPFPNRPTTHIPSKSYVVDYAKPLVLRPVDFKMTEAKTIDVNGYDPFAATTTTKLNHKYGGVELADNKLTYTPKTMNWDGYDTFYVFGQTDDETVKGATANSNGNVWGKVNVIPANNVYYEDTFVTNESTGTVGIIYGNNWTEVQTGQDVNNNPGAAVTPDNNQGWIPALNEETGDTDGSSHHASAGEQGVNADGQPNFATATFTFTGSGVDVYSRTNGQTGVIVATLTQDGKYVGKQIIDTKAASGAYFQIPTLSYHTVAGKPMNGTYTLEIKVTSNAKDRLEYYLDGIRVYKPVAEDDTVKDAYGPDESNASFVEVRDILLDAKSFTGTTVGGAVFIDQLNNGEEGAPGNSGRTEEVGVYKDLGPKNEVYLAKDQSVTVKVDPTQGNKFQVGLKSPAGQKVSASLSNGIEQKKDVNLTHTADMYYDVAANDGFITITNTGDALLSITKLKITNAEAEADLATLFPEVTAEESVAAVRAFSLAPVEPEDPEPPVEPSEPDVDIEEDDGGKEEIHQVVQNFRKFLAALTKKIFEGISKWF